MISFRQLYFLCSSVDSDQKVLLAQDLVSVAATSRCLEKNVRTRCVSILVLHILGHSLDYSWGVSWIRDGFCVFNKALWNIYSVDFLSLSLNSNELLALQLWSMLCEEPPPFVCLLFSCWLQLAPHRSSVGKAVNSTSVFILSTVLPWWNPTCGSHFLAADWRVLKYMNIPTQFPVPHIENIPCLSSSLHSSHCLFFQVFYVSFTQRNRLVVKFNSSIRPQCADEGKWKKLRHTEVKVPSSPVCLSYPAAV